MKRVNLFMMAAFIAASVMFVSCEKDEDELEPSVSVKATYPGKSNVDIFDRQEIEEVEGTDITFVIRFSMGTNKLKEVRMRSVIDGKTFNVLDSVNLDKGLFNTGAKYIDFTYRTNIGRNNENLTFTALDTKERTGLFSVSLKPTTPQVVGEYAVKSATLLGGQKNATTGSFYSVSLGKVLTIGAAKSQSTAVDFAYFYSTANNATIAAPNDAVVADVHYANGLNIPTWATKNATKFFIVEGADGSVPDEWWNNNIDKATNLTKAEKLVAGTVVIYQTGWHTGTNVKGAFVVESVTTTPSVEAGSITIKLIEKVK